MKRILISLAIVLLLVFQALTVRRLYNMTGIAEARNLIATQAIQLNKLMHQYINIAHKLHDCKATQEKTPTFEPDRSFLNQHSELMTPPFKRVPVDPRSSWQ